MRHFIDLRDFSANTLQMMLDHAQAMKKARRACISHEQPLADKTVAMIFEKAIDSDTRFFRGWHCPARRYATGALSAGFAAWAR